MSLNLFGIFCPISIFKQLKNDSLTIIANVKSYLNKKSSLEYILKKMLEIDKMKFILFNEDELFLMRFMDNSSAIIKEKRDPNNLWADYEFENKPNKKDIQKFNEFVNKNENNLSGNGKKILSLI